MTLAANAVRTAGLHSVRAPTIVITNEHDKSLVSVGILFTPKPKFDTSGTALNKRSACRSWVSGLIVGIKLTFGADELSVLKMTKFGTNA